MDKLETGELMQMQLMFLGGVVGSLADISIESLVATKLPFSWFDGVDLAVCVLLGVSAIIFC